MGILRTIAKKGSAAAKKAAEAAEEAAKKSKRGTQPIFKDKYDSQLDEGQAPSRGTLDVESGKAGKYTRGSKSEPSMRDEGRNPKRAKADVALEKEDIEAYTRMIRAENKRTSEKAAAAQGKALGAKTPVSLAGETGTVSVGGKAKLKASDMMVGNTDNGITKDGEIIGKPTANQIATVVRNMNARKSLSAEAKFNLAKLERLTNKQKESMALRKMERSMRNTGPDKSGKPFAKGGAVTGKPRTGHADMRGKGLFK